MECIEARALKSSFLMSQMGVKANNIINNCPYNDDVWCFNGGGTEDFPVEDLLNLDFSEKEFEEYDEEEKLSEKENSENNYYNNNSSNFSEFESLSAGELALPVDELENLEWLSQFVDDSSTGLSLLCPAGSFSAKTGPPPMIRAKKPVRKFVRKTRVPCFPVPFPVKPRSKRSRTNGRTWSMSLTTGDSSSTTSSSHGSSTLSPFVFVNAVHDAEWFSSAEKPTAKKVKRKPESETGLVTGRRCTHCQVNRTPQWRTGPLGPKTLCNACGVRFKSGRLFPEYRPACSPTFSQDLHSNSHRKVLEMRRKMGDEPGTVSM